MAPTIDFKILEDAPDKYGVKKGLLNGQPVRVFGPGQHPVTKEWFQVIVEREHDLAIIGLK
jgi:hypothetical protein